MNKITAIIIGLIILCFGGFVVWSIVTTQSSSVDYDQYDPTIVLPPSEDNGDIGDHVRGKADSPVVFIEYADFQCPGCASVHPKLSALFEEYGDRVAFVFRNFPINGHQNARAAASAAEAAGLQGYFFEMAEILYLNQASWSYSSGSERTSVFADLFQQIAPNGDVAKFKSDIGSSNIAQKISFDYDLGVKKDKITSTPSILINGDIIDLTKASSPDFMTFMREKLDAKLTEFDLPTGPATAEKEAEE